MNQSVQQWLTSRAAQNGTLACGVRPPDGKCICHGVEESCPPARMERILGQFEHIRPAVAGARWSTWTFDQGHIRFAERADGWLLGLVVRADSDAAAKMDALCEEFLKLSAD
jgi:hypothetical protein